MVVAANFAFAQIKPKESEVYEVEPTLFTGEVTGSCPPGLEYDTPYTLDEIKEKWSDAEKNMEEVNTYKVYGEPKDEKVYVEKTQGAPAMKIKKNKKRPKPLN